MKQETLIDTVASAQADIPSPAVKKIHSHDLFTGQRRLVIRHNDADYLLQITRNNKLILTKP